MNNSNQTNSNNNPPLVNFDKVNESLKLITTALNKSCKGGVFESIDDAYLIRISLANLESAIKILEQYQNLTVEKTKEENKE